MSLSKLKSNKEFQNTPKVILFGNINGGKSTFVKSLAQDGIYTNIGFDSTSFSTEIKNEGCCDYGQCLNIHPI